MTATATHRPTGCRIERATADLVIVQADRDGLCTYAVDPTRVTVAPTVDAQPTPEVWAVVALIQDQFPGIDLFLADHNHGDVQDPGSWSIAHEGHYDWPIQFTDQQHTDRAVPANTFCEPIAGWCLGVYPD